MNTPPDPELSPVKRALLEIRDLRARLDDVTRRQSEPVAIIGMGLRFPGGAVDERSFWELLQNGVDAIGPVPADRWDNEALYDPDPAAPGKVTTRFGGFLNDIYQFDAHFFGISPREAETMDPQQRLLLEVTWEALETAGQSPDRLFGTQTGVFLGISNSDYYRLLLSDPAAIDAYATTGNAFSVAGGRLSYTLGLHGPNISVDTACSSSLVAIHLAVQSLRKGESDLALAGGVSLMLSPEITINFSKAHMMAPDGRCKTFDAAADGYGRGEGVAMVTLKRLSDALAAGDPILALIRGSAINHDGRSGGLTAPNGPAQQAVIRAALEDANLEATQIDYVETHGTGTSLGDPIEVHALLATLAQGRPADRPLRIGSVKTNLGHLESAAGIAGLLKAVLALRYGEIPPHLNFQSLNPHILLGDAPLEIPTQRIPWLAIDGPRRAGVSSFGLSGTNAHIILEEAPQPKNGEQQTTASRPLHLLTLSARNQAALNDLATRFGSFLSTSSTELSDVAYTANVGRSPLPHRLALAAGSASEAAQKLADFTAGQSAEGLLHGTPAGVNPLDVAFLFTGHGAHYVNMGRQLYETQPTFRAALDQCDELLRVYLDRSLASVLYPDEPPAGEPLLNQMVYTQPALFALQYALAKLWLSWGVQPAVMLGHSGGEYVAACIAGVFGLEDALKLVAGRGRMLAATGRGFMAAVFADEGRVAEAVAPHADKVSIAVYNTPQNIVISGEEAALDAVLESLRAGGVKFRKLAIGQAAHSPLVDPTLAEFEALAATIHFHEPQIGLVSTVTGQLVSTGEMTQPAYWRRHLRQPVRFATAIQTVHAQGVRTFVEIGPNPVLITNGQRCIPTEGTLWLPSLREKVDDWRQMLEALGMLYIRGAAIDWTGFDADYPRRKLALPTYPFQRSEYRIERTTPPSPGGGQDGGRSVWKSAIAAGDRQATQGPFDLAPQAYPARWGALHDLTVAYIAQAYRQLGVFTQPGAALTAADLLSQFNVQSMYHNLMRRWLDHLASAGLLAQDGDRFTASTPLPDRVAAAWQQAHPVLDEIPTVRDYIRRCGEQLAAVITGRLSPLETLFPGGSFDQADALYQRWAVSRYFIGISQAVAEAVAQATPGRPLRVLELGAGTGATTASILPVLPPERTTYVFTDVSDLFLDRAAQKFQAFSFVRYSLLDLEKSPAEQGYPEHSFDLVIAANVLHATRRLDATLAYMRQLLTPGGLLLVNEATTLLSWFDITTGLIGGWQAFDDGWRTDHPLLSLEQWRQALAASGFERVAAWPEAGAPTRVLGQGIFLAQAPQAGERIEPAATLPAGRAAADALATVAEAEPMASFVEQLRQALPIEREELLVNLVRRQVARVLRVKDVSLIDTTRRLLDLGLDSLMALELRKLLGDALGLAEKELSATLVFDYPTIAAIARYLADEVLALEPTPAALTPAPVEGRQARTVEVADMSEDEVEALLLQKLKRGK
jgi:acyl transferase domain-containing protein/SAM-dependent methyltransferase